MRLALAPATPAAPAAAAGVASLAALLRGAADEMVTLSAMSERLHDLVSRHVAAATADDTAIEEAQAIDLLVQHLDAVGAFLRLLADEAPSERQVDCSRLRANLPLAALAGRLAGGPPAPVDDRAGDLDLF